MKIAILGFGKEGESAFRYWDHQDNQIVIHDNNEHIKTPEGASIVSGQNAFVDLDKYQYDLLVRSPGLRLSEGISTPVTTPTKEFMRHCPAPIIGVTGTKGKGTTATLIAKILTIAGRKVHLLGNIGNPALDELSKVRPDDIVVFEMSSFQLFDIDMSPHVAVCLMVTEDHLDWHKDLEEYRVAKANIFKFQKPEDIAVYYADSKVSSDLVRASLATKRYGYGGTGADVHVEGHRIVAFGQSVANIKDIVLPGKHNLQNICAAIAASWEYNTDIATIQVALKEFTGLPYHIELITEKNNIRYYNDSFSTNPTSAIAAVECFSEPLVLFLGGFDKEADFNKLAKVLKGRSIRKIITYGQTGKKIATNFLSNKVKNVEYMDSRDFAKIIKAGIAVAETGDVVLLSPACASWGMFTDYKARGQQFNDIIHKFS